MVQEFKRPIELVGLKARLERAKATETEIGAIGKRYDQVLDAIDEKKKQAFDHVGHLERYDGQLGDIVKRMIGGGNEPDEEPKKEPASDGGQGGGSSGDKTVTIEVTPGAGGGSGGAGGGNTNGAT